MLDKTRRWKPTLVFVRDCTANLMVPIVYAFLILLLYPGWKWWEDKELPEIVKGTLDLLRWVNWIVIVGVVMRWVRVRLFPAFRRLLVRGD